MYEVRTTVSGRPGRSIRSEFGAISRVPGGVKLAWKQDRDVVEVTMSQADAVRLMHRLSGLMPKPEAA
jgi:hypothetical protein